MMAKADGDIHLGGDIWGAEIDAVTCPIACRRVTRSDHRTKVRIVQIKRLRTTLITRQNP